MENFADPEDKEAPPKSLNDLMNLLLELNDKLRQKNPSRSPKTKESGKGKTGVVIIIMTGEEEKPRTTRSAKTGKTGSGKPDWIENLCLEIEQGSRSRK